VLAKFEETHVKRVDRWLRIGWALLLSFSASAAQTITVGQVAPLKSPDSVGNQMRAGIELCFDAVNRAGGIGGVPLRLVTKDRDTNAADASARTRELLRESKPVALIGLQGTQPMEALLRDGVIAEAGVPIVGIRTGAVTLHSPINPWLFHTRVNYEAEMRRIVEHMLTIGFTRFAVFHEDTAFGKEGLRHAETALADAKLTPLVIAEYAKGTVEVSAAVDAVARTQPHVVLAVGESPAVAEFHRSLRARSMRTQVVTLSTVDAAAVVKRIGAADAHGLAIAQVVPDPASGRSAIAREIQAQARKLRPGAFALTHAAFEGYIAARVLVEALRRSGPQASPAQLRSALGPVNTIAGHRRSARS
jgi:ABC-type branched-subunit amino acid transport system substrate-binding protein